VDDNTAQGPSALTIATGRQIAAERIGARYSLRELSALSGVSVESLHRYELAKRDVPLKALAQIAEALGLRPSEIMAAAEARMERDAQSGRSVRDAPDV
jgi:transcriptional regulator with XRE-family HTH domain